MDHADILAIKYGSTSVANEFGMERSRLDRYVQDIISVSHSNLLPIIISSGSVAVGNSLWAELHRPDDQKPPLQSIATLGSGRAFTAWQAALEKQYRLAGQVLVTHRELSDPNESKTLEQTLRTNIDFGIVSVINENDALSDEELAKIVYGGDNDGLAASISKLICATTLVLLTDKPGLIDENGKVVRTLNTGQEQLDYALGLVNDQSLSGEITNGMGSKLIAGFDAAENGVEVFIGSADSKLRDILSGSCGTQIVA